MSRTVDLHRACASFAVVVFGLAVGAQSARAQRPDFSGDWSQRPPAEGRGGRGGPPADMGSGWGRALTIEQDASALTVQYVVYERGDMQPPLRFHYALDGSATRDTVMMGRGMQVQTSTAAWQGDTLAITTTFEADDFALPPGTRVELRRRLWLDGPASLVIEATRSGVLGGPASTTRTVYGR